MVGAFMVIDTFLGVFGKTQVVTHLWQLLNHPVVIQTTVMVGQAQVSGFVEE